MLFIFISEKRNNKNYSKDSCYNVADNTKIIDIMLCVSLCFPESASIEDPTNESKQEHSYYYFIGNIIQLVKHLFELVMIMPLYFYLKSTSIAYPEHQPVLREF